MTRHSARPLAIGAFALAAVLLSGCTTTAGAPAADACDPASAGAPAAPLPQLGAALREDPPLPGTARSGWPALDGAPSRAGHGAPEAQPGGEHAHHH